MPSKSPAQAKLMRAVAHNPSFAKKVGVPQSVGKEFMKADKYKGKVKKFDLGGPTSYADSGSAGGSNISFKDAFKEARKSGQGTFTWRGKKYTTEMAGEKKSAPAAAPAAPKVESDDMEEVAVTARRKPASTIGEALSSRLGTAAQRKEGKEKGTRSLMDAIRGRFGTQRMREEYKRGMKDGGSVKKYAGGGSVSRRADGIASRGKTRCKIV